MEDIITVIGSINFDILIKTERMPESGETVSGDKIYYLPGGKGANQTVAIARLGKKVYFIGKKGRDPLDGITTKNLYHKNINLKYFIEDKRYETGVALINTTGGRGNRVTYYPGANFKLTPSDIEKAEDVIKKSKVVVICTEIPIPTVKKALSIAKKHKVKTILNVSVIGNQDRKELKKLLKGIDILVVNEKAAGYLTERVVSHMETGNVAAQELRKMGVNHVIITMGKEGTLLINQHGATVFHRYGVKVVDTIGGGDAFIAGIAVKISEGSFVVEGIDYGNIAGALAVQKIGAQEALPTKEEIEIFAKEKCGLGKFYKKYTPLIKKLEEKALKIRLNIIKMLGRAGSGHLGGSLSAVDIITALYFKVLRIDPKNPKWEKRDRFVLSKGHAAPALYAALSEAGFFPEEKLWTLRKIDEDLAGHPDMKKTPGVDMTTGSLGQGLSVANGMAISSKLKKLNYRVYVLLGDGEIQEGQIWEAAMTASHNRLDNLCAILDYNGLQIDGSIGEVKAGLEPVVDKWKAFNWHVIEIDGHNLEAILEAFDEAKKVKGKPTIIIARTIKGKGVSFMERKVEYHGVAPTEEECKRAFEELGYNYEEEK